METSEIMKVEDRELGVSSLLNLNKSYMASIVHNATNAVVDGQYDAINALVIAKKGQELFGQLEKAVRPIAEDHVKLGKGEVYRKFNVDITQAETGVSYDFTVCGDTIWEELKAKVDTYSRLLKERENTLKTITKPVTMINDETGEVMEIKPPIRGGKLGLKLSIK